MRCILGLERGWNPYKSPPQLVAFIPHFPLFSFCKMEMGSLPQRSVAKPPSFLSVEIIEEQPRPSSELTQEVSPTIIQSPTSAFLEAPRVKRNKSTRSSKSLPTSTLCSSPNDDSDLGEDSFVTFDVPNRGVKEKLKHWQSGDPFYEQTELLKETENDAWEIAYALAREHDKGMCSAWREEIDKLMIFAGLFAATVVAFLVVSYQMLQPNPSVVQNQIYVSLYTTWVALYQAHLNGTTMVDIQFPSPPSSSVFQPSGSVLRMNAVWFLSLTLSLGTVLIGTICLQWIREYERDTRRGPRKASPYDRCGMTG
ncbi:hypothetical protein BDZ97DRAFT_1967881 [Flammula alnicola]|nr:hypothetical protein BDZ97DRAFT_1967881 [Flammula alnicola]